MECRCLVASSYLNWYWPVINWKLRNKIRWNLNEMEHFLSNKIIVIMSSARKWWRMINWFSFKKMRFKISFAKWRPFCSRLNLLMNFQLSSAKLRPICPFLNLLSNTQPCTWPICSALNLLSGPHPCTGQWCACTGNWINRAWKWIVGGVTWRSTIGANRLTQRDLNKMADILQTIFWSAFKISNVFEVCSHGPQLTINEYQKSGKLDLQWFEPRQSGRHFADDVSKYIFLHENLRILIHISLKSVPVSQEWFG